MKLAIALMVVVLATFASAYDPDDKEIATIIPPEGMFEAFFPRETNGRLNSPSRAAHNHGSFFQHRNPGNQLTVDKSSATLIWTPFSPDRRQECGGLRLSLWWKAKIQFRLRRTAQWLIHGSTILENKKLFTLPAHKAWSFHFAAKVITASEHRSHNHFYRLLWSRKLWT